MRTTIKIPDDVYDAVRAFAGAKGIRIGEAVVELIRKALAPEARTDNLGIFPRFPVSPQAAPITLEQTLAAAGYL